MNRVLILIVFPLLISCSSTPDGKSSTHKSTAPATKTDSQNLEKEKEVRIDTFSLESLESPSGLIIGEYYASDNTEYSFCQDHRLKITYTDSYFKTGKWQMKSDTILMTLLKEYKKVGIGDPLRPPPAVPGNYQERYSKYKEVIDAIHETEMLDFSELISLLKDDGEYPYRIIDRGIDCRSKDFEEFKE
jgi:hypothetical protein